MAAMFVIIGFLSVGLSDSMQEYARHSNGKNEYRLVWASPCEGGLRPSGYALASGQVLFKQVNDDGSVGPVCAD